MHRWMHVCVQASFYVLADEDDVVLSPFSKPAQQGAAGETSCSQLCFADELEQEILELEKAPQLEETRLAACPPTAPEVTACICSCIA